MDVILERMAMPSIDKALIYHIPINPVAVDTRKKGNIEQAPQIDPSVKAVAIVELRVGDVVHGRVCRRRRGDPYAMLR